MRFTRSEVYAYAEREATVVRRVELVVADVSKTNVVGQVGIEQVVSHAAAKPQTAVSAIIYLNVIFIILFSFYSYKTCCYDF